MNDDTGARLRSLYAADGGVGVVFSSKVTEYAESRPGYPPALFDGLSEMGALPPGATVADIGAGTGLLTRSLLERGHGVFAVEPSAEMRAAADASLGACAGYRSIAASAEATSLPDACVDLVTAAQAFHWFDALPARREFLRILKTHGQVALIWNDRLHGDPLHAALDELFAEFGGARRDALVAHEDRSNVPPFFGGGPTQQIDLPNEHRLSRAGLRSLVFSRSYMPAAGTDAGAQAQRRVDAVFDRLAIDCGVVVRYRTLSIVGRPMI